MSITAPTDHRPRPSPARLRRIHGRRAARGAAAAPLARPDPSRHPLASLQHPDRGHLRGLGPSLHPVQRQAPPGHDGRGGSPGVPDPPGDGSPRGVRHAEPGEVGAAVSLQGGAGAGPALARGHRRRKGPAATSGGAHAVRSHRAAAAAVRHPLAGRLAAVRHRHAAARGAAPAGAGRRVPSPRDRGPQWQGRKGPGDGAAREPHPAAAPAAGPHASASPTRSRRGEGRVILPDALAVKYRDATRAWGWQWVFPGASLSIDPRSGIRSPLDGL